MIKYVPPLLALALFTAAPALADTAALRDAALKDDVAWEIVKGLTTEIGPRLAGSEAEARARRWAVARLTSLGFKNVRIETFDIAGWQRGEEMAEIAGAFPQKLAIAALGHSGATPAKGLLAEVIGFPSLELLEKADESLVKGKIVFISHRMPRTQDASAYSFFGKARNKGPSIAARKGAAAVLVRSMGTDGHRMPHTGVTSWGKDQKPIPAAALSIPDAEQLERLLALGPVKLTLVLTPKFTGTVTSGNVIGEIPGSDPNAGIVVVGGHLDSWDLGTGAIDDGAGVAITTAAALASARNGPPRRTIRVVWFGSEEIGGTGGEDYAHRHGGEKHVLAAESDFGADRVWRLDTGFPASAAPVVSRLQALLAPLGVTGGLKETDGGADVEPLAKAGVPIVTLQQDGSRYFDLHHTADDTLDKIDPEQLRQNVAAWTALLGEAAFAPDWPEKSDVQPPPTQ